MRETPQLAELSGKLEFRWRLGIFVTNAATALIISLGGSLVLSLVHILSVDDLAIGRLILMINGAAIVVALTLAALRQRSPQALLSDADRHYGTRELLSSAAEFATPSGRAAGATESAFRQIVITQAEEKSSAVVPAEVYPTRVPRRFSAAGALFLTVALLFLLDWSGWFERPGVELAEEGFLLEDAGRRLAEGGRGDELQDLADEIRRLGERLRDGDMDAEETRRRIDQLGERVEEQIQNLERLGELATNQETELPPETEENVRNALRSGMTEGEVLDFFMSMSAEGETFPDALRALEEATADTVPDTNLGLDNDRVRELLDQLNLNPGTTADPGLEEDLESIRQSLQQAGVQVQELTEGESDGSGPEGSPGRAGRGGQEEQGESAGDASESTGPTDAGQEGGDQAVSDAMEDSFNRIEEANPIFRQIEGIMGQGTIRDVIVRELPAEAISRLDETEREIAFERVIEEAVGRGTTPPELQQLVRNYFLRITLGSDQGEQDEQ